MKSRKKTSKLSILIVFNKGIASIKGIELAMLFCHAGFSVKTMLAEKARAYIPIDALKEITGHLPWHDLAKPNWAKADIKYLTAIIIEPEVDFLDCVLSDKASLGNDQWAAYIKANCQNIKVLQKTELIDQTKVDCLPCQLFTLPQNLLSLREVFEKILADTIKMAANTALNKGISYYFEGELSRVGYLAEIERALNLRMRATRGTPPTLCATSHEREAKGTTPTPFNSSFDEEANLSREASLVVTKGEKSLIVILENTASEKIATKGLVYLNRQKNGLILQDLLSTRLLPSLSCQNCYNRLVDYLAMELNRLQ